MNEIKLPVATQLNFFDIVKPTMAKYKAITTPREMFPNFKKGYSPYGFELELQYLTAPDSPFILVNAR